MITKKNLRLIIFLTGVLFLCMASFADFLHGIRYALPTPTSTQPIAQEKSPVPTAPSLPAPAPSRDVKPANTVAVSLAIQTFLKKTDQFKEGGWQNLKSFLADIAQTKPGLYQWTMDYYTIEIHDASGIDVTKDQIELELANITGYVPPRIDITLPDTSTPSKVEYPDTSINLEPVEEPEDIEYEEEEAEQAPPSKPSRPNIGLPSTSTSSSTRR